jgi:hypothetical protein
MAPRGVASILPAASKIARPAADRLGGMIGAREAGDEQPNRLVADEFVDHAVLGDDRRCGDPIEGGKDLGELSRSEPLAEAGRTADIGEQERKLDLGAADTLLGKRPHAVLAELRVALPWSKPWPQDETADPAERCVAHLAVRR